LSVVNPCGFPLLLAFLSFYLGADEDRLPQAPTRVPQGLVAVGFLGLFTAVGLPVSLGDGAIGDAVPWVGLVTGVILALAGVSVVAGRRIRVAFVPRPRALSERRFVAMVLFGLGIVWDAFYAFAPATRWGAWPSDVVATGAPIIGGVDKLQARFVPLLGGS
jgi:cytochrome c biogenesis protein CcdA